MTDVVFCYSQDRLLKMKLAHMPVAARLKYLQSTDSYTGETDLATLRMKTPVDKVGGTIEHMCRELAIEICDVVVNKVRFFQRVPYGQLD